MQTSPAKAELQKKRNRKCLLDLLREQSRMSVKDLAQQSGLSHTTVHKILGYFESTGYVFAIGKGQSTAVGGKKPDVFTFNSRAGYICALSIREEHSFGGVTDLSGRLLLNMRKPHPADAKIQQIVDNISEMIAAAVDAANLSPEKLVGVALGCDGLIDSANGLICRALHFPSWGEDAPLADLVRVALGRDIFVSLDNALAQLALGELNEDPSLGGKRVLTLFHGDSVYAGLLEPVPKAHPIARAVHIGQMRLESGQEYGELSNAFAVLKHARSSGVFVDSLEALFLQAESGEKLAETLMEDLLDLHCRALYNVMLLFSPDIIIVQGDYAALGKPFCESLHRLLTQQKPLQIGNEFEIRPSTLDMDRGFLIGAAMSMIDTIFDDDRVYELSTV